MKDDEMLAFIEEKLNEREVFYLQADVVLSREQQELLVLLNIINSELWQDYNTIESNSHGYFYLLV